MSLFVKQNVFCSCCGKPIKENLGKKRILCSDKCYEIMEKKYVSYVMGKEYAGEEPNSPLNAYMEAINEIDDFFEYANESRTDRKRVHEILGRLTEKLVKIYNHKE